MFINYDVLGLVPQVDIDAYLKVCDIALLIQDYANQHYRRPIYRCHSIARALQQHIPHLKSVDGHYVGVVQTKGKNGKVSALTVKYYPHTWLTTPTGTIIDPYPVGKVSQPLLIPNSGDLTVFGQGVYYVNGILPKKLLRKFNTPEILAETKILARHIEMLLSKKK